MNFSSSSIISSLAVYSIPFGQALQMLPFLNWSCVWHSPDRSTLITKSEKMSQMFHTAIWQFLNILYKEVTCRHVVTVNKMFFSACWHDDWWQITSCQYLYLVAKDSIQLKTMLPLHSVCILCQWPLNQIICQGLLMILTLILAANSVTGGNQ